MALCPFISLFLTTDPNFYSETMWYCTTVHHHFHGLALTPGSYCSGLSAAVSHCLYFVRHNLALQSGPGNLQWSLIGISPSHNCNKWHLSCVLGLLLYLLHCVWCNMYIPGWMRVHLRLNLPWFRCIRCCLSVPSGTFRSDTKQHRQTVQTWCCDVTRQLSVMSALLNAFCLKCASQKVSEEIHRSLHSKKCLIICFVCV